MSKFIILYNGPATDPMAMDEAKRNSIMEAWKVWMNKLGSALTDVGAPMGPSKAVVDDGSDKPALELSGYSIIEADNLDAAVGLVSDHPFLSDKSGKFSVEVFELLPVPM